MVLGHPVSGVETCYAILTDMALQKHGTQNRNLGPSLWLIPVFDGTETGADTLPYLAIALA